MNTNSPQRNEETKIDELLEMLCSDDGLKRKEARKLLVESGKTVLPSVIELLDRPKHAHRWEAIKVIAEMHSPEAIPVLLEALTDDSGDIRWIASEGLIHTGHYSVKPLLELILEKHDSVFVLTGAHHIFNELKIKKSLPENFPAVELLNLLKASSNASSLRVLVHETWKELE